MSWLERGRRYAVELDIAYDDHTLHLLREHLLDGLTIDVEIVADEGPSGWPLARFTGVPDQLLRLLGRYHDGDEEAAYEALDAAEPVEDA